MSVGYQPWINDAPNMPYRDYLRAWLKPLPDSAPRPFTVQRRTWSCLPAKERAALLALRRSIIIVNSAGETLSTVSEQDGPDCCLDEADRITRLRLALSIARHEKAAEKRAEKARRAERRRLLRRSWTAQASLDDAMYEALVDDGAPGRPFGDLSEHEPDETSAAPLSSRQPSPEAITYGESLLSKLRAQCGARCPHMAAHCDRKSGHGGTHSWSGSVKWLDGEAAPAESDRAVRAAGEFAADLLNAERKAHAETKARLARVSAENDAARRWVSDLLPEIVATEMCAEEAEAIANLAMSEGLKAVDEHKARCVDLALRALENRWQR